MFLKIKNRLLPIWEKLPWPALILFGIAALYGWIFKVDFPIPRYAEWDTLSMFEKKETAFPATADGWPLIPQLITHLFYFFGGWNIRAFLALNYLIYIADMILLYRLIEKAAGSYSFLPFFFIPFFSDLNVWNLMETTALQIHLTIFFGLWAADIGFQRLPTYRNSFFFLLFLALSVFSMNAVFATVVFFGWAFMELLQRKWRKVLGAFLLFFVIKSVSALKAEVYFFSGFSEAFRKTVMSVSAALSGFDLITDFHFILILPVIGALLAVVYEKKLWKDRDTLTLLTIGLAFFFSAFQRVSLPLQPPFSFISAGCGFVIFLVPVIFTLLRTVRPVFIYACCFAVLGYSADFSYRSFHTEALFRKTALQCAREYYSGTTHPAACVWLQDKRLPAVLDQAKALNLNFVRSLSSGD